GEEVTQTPRHLVKGKGQKAILYCVPIIGHGYVFWYQQVRKEFKFLISFQNENIFDETAMPKKRFSVKCPQNSPCSLEIQATGSQDSAVYFCASSQSTVLNIS
uniref:T cell receptor beta variable 16 n=1 Tax=Cebus imitator TaxID=2715852 RepID=A0A2K5PH80_CEBIM